MARSGRSACARGLTDAAVERGLFEARMALRMPYLAADLALVAAADIRWMLALSAPR